MAAVMAARVEIAGLTGRCVIFETLSRALVSSGLESTTVSSPSSSSDLTPTR